MTSSSEIVQQKIQDINSFSATKDVVAAIGFVGFKRG